MKRTLSLSLLRYETVREQDGSPIVLRIRESRREKQDLLRDRGIIISFSPSSVGSRWILHFPHSHDDSSLTNQCVAGVLVIKPALAYIFQFLRV